MKKILSIAITMILLSSIFLIAAPTKGANTIADVEPVDWQSGLAGNVPMPTLTAEDLAESQRASAVFSAQMTPPMGTTVWDWYLRSLSRSYRGVIYPWMTLRAISGNVEIWVAQNESLKYLPGDPRNADPLDWYVTDAMCQFIADEFNNVIYPNNVNYFGASADRYGTNGYFFINKPPYAGSPPNWPYWIETANPQRVIIKIFNIIDDSFFDPTYPAYVVGFFNPTYDSTGYYDRNMIHIDNWKYWQRLGEEGRVWFPSKGPVTRPYVYESTVVHEYQHLIHSDWNPSDPSFMNEGCSMYSELLAGYGIDPAYLNYYFYTPDNSLTEWEDLGGYDVLADYGESALWTIYLSDHYGGAPFIRSFVQNGIPGIDGVNYALAEYGYKQRFDDVFHDWKLANLIRASSGPYSYKSLDLNAPGIIPVRMYPVNGFPVPWTTGTSFGSTFAINGYDTGVSRLGPYGTDYIAFRNWDRPGFIAFDGDDTAVYGWRYDNQMDTKLTGQAYVDPANPTLTLVTAYGLETEYDYGCVQVSTDNGQTWTSLANAYTSSNYQGDMQIIFDNLPGLNDYNPDFPGWTTMTFDLSAYSGMNVMINFRYLTDEYTNYEGWFIQSASVSGIAPTLTATYPKASYQVTAVKAVAADGKFVYVPYDLRLNTNTWTGEHNTFAKNPTYIILVVSPTMLNGDVDYQFRVYKK
jgi:hypothetical protein